MSGAKKTHTRKAAVPPPVDNNSDSDDAPEEFTQAEARELVFSKRNEERQVLADQRRQQKQLRRDRQTAAEQVARHRDTSEGAEAALGSLGATGDDEGAPAKDATGGAEDEDLLPESVLQAVAANEAQQGEAALAAAKAAEASRRAQRREAKRQRLQEVKQSVVKVQVLSKLQAPTARINYVKEALYSSRLKRSVDMLSKERGKPSAKFA